MFYDVTIVQIDDILLGLWWKEIAAKIKLTVWQPH